MNTYEQQSSFKILEINASDLRQILPGEMISTFNSCGLVLCKKGTVKVDSEHKHYDLQPSDFFVYMPSSSAKIIDQDDDFEGIIVEAYLDYTLPLINRIITTGCLICIRQRPIVTLNQEQYKILIYHINYLISNIKETERQSSLNPCDILRGELINSTAHSLINEILLFYFTNQTSLEVQETKNDIVFQNFIISIYRNYQKERDVAFYAREQNMNPRYFSTVIKKNSGQNARSWITRMVIADARQKLSRSDLSIKEISFLLNFPSQTFFGKYFKLYTGMSPREFRNRERLL